MNSLRPTISGLIVLFSLIYSVSGTANTDLQAYAAPAGPSYKIASNLLSQSCEFYVDSFGDAHDSSQGQDVRWLEAQIRIGDVISRSNQNKLLTTGVYVEYIIDANSNSRTELFFEPRGNPYFLHRIPYSDSNPNQASYKKISVFNFFIDVLTPSQGIVRYWMTSKAYTFQAAFWGYPYRYLDRGNGAGVTYIQYPSPVLDKRKACAQG